MPDFNFTATGVGSVPFNDIQGTCRDILERFPQAPFWPQFVKLSHQEDMIIQYSEGLPLLEIVEDKRALRISGAKDKEAELVSFYDHCLSDQTDYITYFR